MSNNDWLYAYARQVILVDRTGLDPEDPCGAIPPDAYEEYIQCQLNASIPPRIVSADVHNPAVNPWNITYIGQNLAAPIIIGSLGGDLNQQQFIVNGPGSYPDTHEWVDDYLHSDYHSGLCGLISIAALLNSVIPNGITANQVVDDFIAYNEYYNTDRYVINHRWPDYQNIEELHDFISASYFGYLAVGLPGVGGFESRRPEPIRTWLSQGSFAISGVGVGQIRGIVGRGTSPHWLVITGISHQWVEGQYNWDSPWNWVRVYNPFTNRTEYYPYRIFKDSHESFYGIMRVDRRSRGYTIGLINALIRNGTLCDLPPFVLRRLR
jgi:hypothetical protein